MTEDDGTITGLRFAKAVVWLVYAYFVLALIVLTLTFFLQLFNASPTAGFTEWVYRNADRVMEPFRGIFPTKDLGEQGSVIDFAVVFAIIMYGIFALVVQNVVQWLDRKIIGHRAALRDQEAEATARAQMQASPQTPPQTPPQQ